VRRAREEFRDQEKVINESKIKKKNQTEDLYIDMKKTGCSDPASCPFSLVEECVNKLEGVLFERRRKLDDRLRRAEAEAEREREQISDQEAEAEHEKRRQAQLDSEREKLEREKKLMETELRERARLLKQELLKLRGDGGPSSNLSPRSLVSPRTSARSEPPSTRADPPAASPKPETSWEKTSPDPRKILNAECTSGSSTCLLPSLPRCPAHAPRLLLIVGSFLLRRVTRREEETAPCSSCKKALGHTQMLLVDGRVPYTWSRSNFAHCVRD
jgi:hypothetical protein